MAAHRRGRGLLIRARAGGYPLVATVFVLLSGLLPAGTDAATTLIFNPIADAHVAVAAPNNNYGSVATLRTRESAGTTSDPTYRAYLMFDVSGLSGMTMTSVTLRLYSTDESPNGQGIHRVASTSWVESTINNANAPAFDTPALVTTPAPSLNAYNDFVLPTSAIGGDGRVSFAIKSTGNNNFAFNS